MLISVIKKGFLSRIKNKLELFLKNHVTQDWSNDAES